MSISARVKARTRVRVRVRARVGGEGDMHLGEEYGRIYVARPIEKESPPAPSGCDDRYGGRGEYVPTAVGRPCSLHLRRQKSLRCCSDSHHIPHLEAACAFRKPLSKLRCTLGCRSFVVQRTQKFSACHPTQTIIHKAKPRKITPKI